ncbi:MAG TPA: DNA cytosine methyltransferase, partial [Oscillatoriales cyanobacterium M59_W2019_021]|nr:DNA cytosine methyltransferase [Oscillatoriales cyanobacterium M59_W2019_021]
IYYYKFIALTFNLIGRDDSRDMFPEFIRAVLKIEPLAFVAENVTALVGQKLVNTFERRSKILKTENPMLSLPFTNMFDSKISNGCYRRLGC